MALRRTPGIIDPPVYDEVDEVGVLTLTLYHGGKEVELFVQRADLDSMLREEAVNGEINLVDVDDEDGAEEGKATFNHTEFISQSIHDEINNIEGDRDCIGNDDEGFRSEHDSSDDDDHCKLDSFPKYNSKTDERNPRFAIGMLFSCRVELKTTIDTFEYQRCKGCKVH
ncbi:hypothetical protein LIER_38110 [Lithospermum erythrorhizon]|uniref:Transposase n=1 Tax=Lithospermum erythrorhizon TaxID=34254 RepID=A0AAV3PYW6_LITER